ncbi:hypothetical protein [Streptomyces silaceus]|uniref:hypothetical protein n=1 Tax=Streptomyces silaceus TaxID=545123 RepID=UPI0012FEED68|nr:hypothetical protein [Streptomyces silaceus]
MRRRSGSPPGGACLERMAVELREHLGERARDEALLLMVECTPRPVMWADLQGS